MLMNLTRLRHSSWEEALLGYLHQYKNDIEFGDQGLINIYGYFYPGINFVLVMIIKFIKFDRGHVLIFSLYKKALLRYLH